MPFRPLDLSLIEQYVKNSKDPDSKSCMIRKIKDFVERPDLANTKGIQRIILVCESIEQLSFEQAYRLIDPDGFIDEFEASLSEKFAGLLYARIFFSIAPLVWTWSALWLASTTYQQTLHPDKTNLSFLALWQNGFNGLTWLTFSRTAIIDALMLGSFLAVTLGTIYLEQRARTKSLLFAQQLQEITYDLLEVVKVKGISRITYDTDIDKVVQAFKGIVEDLFHDSEKTVKAASEAVTQSNARMEELFDERIDPLVAQFAKNSQGLAASARKLSQDVSSFTSHVDREQLRHQLDLFLNTLASLESKLTDTVMSLQNTANVITSTTRPSFFSWLKKIFRRNAKQQKQSK